MFTEQKLEMHYSKLPSNELHIIRDEYQWALNECGVHTEEQIKYIEKVLSLRGESLQVRVNRKVLFLCKCGQSRIVEPTIPEDQIKMFVFEQYSVPCTKCGSKNMYTWKFME